jgi:hypothetical protein
VPGGPGLGPERPAPPGTGPAPGPAGQDARAEALRRARSVRNLKQIALAVHNYHDVFGTLPAVIKDDQGQPLLSWRVALLPYLEQDALYRAFKLDEPWDSPHNRKLLAQMPPVYRIEGAGPASSTFYQGFVGKGTLFEDGKRIRLSAIPDGTSNTLLVVEAGRAVPWTKPEDIPYAADRPIPKLGGPFRDVFHAAFADGQVYTLKKNFNEKEMRKAIVRDDGFPLDLDLLKAPRARQTGLEPATLRQENRKLELTLREANEEVERLRKDLARLQDTLGVRRKEQQEIQQLLDEQERLKKAVEETTAELKALRDEVERLKRALER